MDRIRSRTNELHYQSMILRGFVKRSTREMNLQKFRLEHTSDSYQISFDASDYWISEETHKNRERKRAASEKTTQSNTVLHLFFFFFP